MSTNKENIQNVALKLFLAKGYNVGINEIIEKANTSKGAFYHHYKSKEQLFVEIIERFFFSCLDEFESIESLDLTFEDKILQFVEMVFIPFKEIKKQFGENNPVNFLNIFSEYPKNKILHRNSKLFYKRIIVFLEHICTSAVKEKEITKNIDVQTLSLHIVMLIDGAIVDSLLIFTNFDEAREECLKAIKQLLYLLK